MHNTATTTIKQRSKEEEVERKERETQGRGVTWEVGRCSEKGTK